MADLTEAVTWFAQSHLRYTHAFFALWLGDAYLLQGDVTQARGIFKAVLAICQEAGYRHLSGVAERGLGESFMAEEPAAAAEHLAVALRILEEVGARNEVAKTLVAQANLHRTAGDVNAARALLERALALFETLGTLDEPRRVQAILATLQDHRHA
jgi:tetratricopeptide (TPR) repeat protein